MKLSSELLQSCWFLAGPTACGKSEAGIELARRIECEIVSMDSMALYRRMNIGTAKPTPEQRVAAPHHLVDVLEPHEEFSVAQYIAAADQAARAIVSRGRIPLFVGGTGLYLRSLLRGVFDGPAGDPQFRRALEAEAAHVPLERFHERLQEVDPAAAGRIHPHDARRIIRALEVHARTGRTLTESQQQTPLPADQRPRNVFWLSPPRRWLHDRINDRVNKMFAAGLIEEVRGLLAEPRPLSRTARQALGYQEVIRHLEQGVSLADTVVGIQTRTRQFAKRQHTWFRHLEECRPIETSGEEMASQLADRILAAAGRPNGSVD